MRVCIIFYFYFTVLLHLCDLLKAFIVISIETDNRDKATTIVTLRTFALFHVTLRETILLSDQAHGQWT